ncbi:MAG TPA: FAD-dependent oxidoreductase [Jatrophihabitans sp.]|jgi:sarcosine oxidase subunit beta|uniref:NAD(P)/FAD-dependent oxidoreductase n=1 Tax=Jatrophihabitans sp. TaxID=1932789 RepID=UPI002DF9ECC0|nr:FAD-dependent oxidoreductase [Jatrophihabitans sp.]
MSESVADVVVVGAGAIGASSAFQLASAGHRVTLVEALDGPAEGSTGRSFASIRGQWADELNVELSWRSIRAYRDFPAVHGIDVGYRPSGYLLLVSEPAWAAQLEAVELQRAHGVPVEVLPFAAAQERTPFETAGLGGTTWGPADGVVDPHLASSAYVELARARGAQVCYRSPVREIDPHADGGWSVRAGDRTIRTQYLVNAAGGWSGEVARLAGLDVPVVHSRRNVYSSAPGALDRAVPMTVDFTSGVYLRSDGSRLLFGGARPDEVDGYNVHVDWSWMEALLEAGTRRFPWLVDVPLDRAGCWAGTYENTPDHHGIVGPAPAAPTWINACGFSGHGMMQAPEIGRLVAEQITTGAITSVDASALRLERFTEARATRPVELVF